jgi:hypothetical protein
MERELVATQAEIKGHKYPITDRAGQIEQEARAIDFLTPNIVLSFFFGVIDRNS